MTNIFDILGIVGREDPISDLLAFSLEAAPGFRRAFFNDFLCMSDRSVKAETRTRMGDSGLPDLIVVPESDRDEICLFENKLKADEGWDQTVRYASDEVAELLSERFERGPKPDINYFFLSLYPDQEPQDKTFVSKRYSDLIPILRSYPRGEAPAVDQLLSDLCALLEAFYGRSALNDSDLTTTALADTTEIDRIGGGYLAFRTMMRALSLPGGVEIHGFFRLSARGRQAYGALITRQSWAPDPMPDPAAFDPIRHFNVHFEPQYNLLAGRLEMALHFEVNPYHTRDWCKRNLSAESLNRFEAIRRGFRASLADQSIEGLKITSYWLQMGKAVIPVDGLTVGEAKSRFETFLEATTPAVDHALRTCLDSRL